MSFRWTSCLPRRAYFFTKASKHTLVKACGIGVGGIPGTIEPVGVRFVVGDPFGPPVAETQDFKTQDGKTKRATRESWASTLIECRYSSALGRNVFKSLRPSTQIT